MGIAYVHISKKHYCLIIIIDGCSQFIFAWVLREKMEDSDVGIVQQNALERFPEASGRFITDNVSQVIGKESRSLLRSTDSVVLKHPLTTSKVIGKLKVCTNQYKRECIRKKYFVDVDFAREVIAAYVDYYNEVCLRFAIGYVAPQIRLE